MVRKGSVAEKAGFSLGIERKHRRNVWYFSRGFNPPFHPPNLPTNPNGTRHVLACVRRALGIAGRFCIIRNEHQFQVKRLSGYLLEGSFQRALKAWVL